MSQNSVDNISKVVQARRARARRGVVAAVSAMMLLPSAPAEAIIGGQPDGTGHPYVGAIDVRPTGLTIPASGVLVSPTVYVTAGHVTHYFDQAGVTPGERDLRLRVR